MDEDGGGDEGPRELDEGDVDIDRVEGEDDHDDDEGFGDIGIDIGCTVAGAFFLGSASEGGSDAGAALTGSGTSSSSSSSSTSISMSLTTMKFRRRNGLASPSTFAPRGDRGEPTCLDGPAALLYNDNGDGDISSGEASAANFDALEGEGEGG